MKAFVKLLKTFVLLEVRSKEVSVVIFSSVLLISLLLAMGAGTAFLDPYSITKIFPFVFWASIITSCSVALGRAFETEMCSGVMEALVTSGIDLRAIYFAKQIVVATVLFIAMALGLIILGGVFAVGLFDFALPLSLLCLVISIAFSALGNILSVLSLGSRLRSALLPIILIPACFPIFFAALELTYGILQKDPEILSSPWVGFSILLAVFYSLLGAALFPAAVRAQF